MKRATCQAASDLLPPATKRVAVRATWWPRDAFLPSFRRTEDALASLRCCLSRGRLRWLRLQHTAHLPALRSRTLRAPVAAAVCGHGMQQRRSDWLRPLAYNGKYLSRQAMT